MKFSAASLKSLDYKKLAIDHGEKLVVGIIGLLVVMIIFVPLFGGSFARYDKTPQELKQNAQTTLTDIQQSQWPEEEKNSFLNADSIDDKLALVTSPVNPDLYIPTIDNVLPPLYSKKEPRKEVETLTVEKPLVLADRALFELPSSESEYQDSGEPGADNGLLVEGGDSGTVPLEKKDDDLKNIPEKFRPRTGQSPGGAEGFGPGRAGSYMTPNAAETGYMENAALDYMSSPMGMDTAEMMGGGYGMVGQKLEGRGYRYALIRSVFNIRLQRELAAKALSIPESALNSPTAEFDITGFDIARREYHPAIEPWDKVEEKQILDKMKSMRVLMSLADFDFDPVDYSVSHHEITSPLPKRIVGTWGKTAGHPKIDNYIENTEEGRKLDQFLTTFLAEQEEKNQELKKMFEKPGEGFSRIQRNVRGMASQYFQGGSGMNSFMEGMQNMYSGKGPGNPSQQQQPGKFTPAEKQKVEQDVSRISAGGTLLLFRYFDFDVEPGKTYQYRVRLIFNNPNYDRPVIELADPNSRLEKTRKSPWCEATDPVTVPKDTEYFLTKVDYSPQRRDVESRLDIFQWKEEYGTVVRHELSSVPGEYIGGEAETELLNHKEHKFEKQKVEFTSNDVMVDYLQGIDVDLSEHPDLGLPRDLNRRFRIVEGALVKEQSGRLVKIDPVSSGSDKKNAEQRLEWQNTPFEYLKDQPEAGEDGLMGLEGYMGGGACGGAEGGGEKAPRGRRAKARSKNKLRKDPGAMGMESVYQGMMGDSGYPVPGRGR